MLHLILSLSMFLTGVVVPASVQTRQITVTNSFSYDVCSAGSPGVGRHCSLGSFGSFFIAPKPTFFSGSAGPFPGTRVLPDGFGIGCAGSTQCPNGISLVSVVQFDNYVQVNAFFDGYTAVSGFGALHRIFPAPGTPFASASGDDTVTVLFGEVPSPDFPTECQGIPNLGSGQAAIGILSADNSGTGIIGGTHYNTQTGVYTAFTTCAQDSSQCPKSTNGQPNYLVFYTTGGDLFRCSSLFICNFRAGNPGFIVNGAVLNEDFVGRQSPGLEQWNIPIPLDHPVGTFPVSFTRNGIPYLCYNPPNFHNLTVTIGPAN